MYNKERSTFVDASFLHNDWWQRVRDLFNPPAEEGEDSPLLHALLQLTAECSAPSHCDDLDLSLIHI